MSTRLANRSHFCHFCHHRSLNLPWSWPLPGQNGPFVAINIGLDSGVWDLLIIVLLMGILTRMNTHCFCHSFGHSFSNFLKFSCCFQGLLPFCPPLMLLLLSESLNLFSSPLLIFLCLFPDSLHFLLLPFLLSYHLPDVLVYTSFHAFQTRSLNTSFISDAHSSPTSASRLSTDVICQANPEETFFPCLFVLLYSLFHKHPFSLSVNFFSG